MARLRWGTGIGLTFLNDSEYYFVLGFLSNRANGIDIYTHQNDLSGAWGGQGKLHNRSTNLNLPRALATAFNKSGDDRLSVSDYVRNLVDYHAFDGWSDRTGNRYTFYRFPTSIDLVRATIPSAHMVDFESGLMGL